MVVEAAIAAAARQAGYPGFAELISDGRLNLQVVASRFRRFSLAGDKGRTLALILAAGRVARYRANPVGPGNRGEYNSGGSCRAAGLVARQADLV
jgi:hypothetical protein